MFKLLENMIENSLSLHIKSAIIVLFSVTCLVHPNAILGQSIEKNIQSIGEQLSTNKTFSKNLIEDLESTIGDESLSNQGLYFYHRSRWERHYGSMSKALEYGIKADSLYSSSSKTDEFYYCKIKYYLSDIYGYNNRLDEAYNKAIEALDVCKQNPVEKEMANVYFSCHTSCFEMGKTGESLYYLEKAMEIDKKLGDSLTIMAGLNSLSALNYQLFNYEETIKLAKESFEYLPSDNFKSQRSAVIHSTIGAAYLKLEKLDSAQYFLDIAQKEIAVSNDSVEIARIYLKRAELLVKRGDDEGAFILAGKCKEISEKANLKSISVRAKILMAKLNPSPYEAYVLLQEVYDSNIDLSNEGVKDQMLKTEASVYGKLGNYTKQAKLFEQYMELKEQAFTDESRKLVTSLTTTFELKEKDKEMELAALNHQLVESNLKKKNNLLMWALGLALISLIALYFFLRQQRKIKNLQIEQVVQEKTNQVESLRAEISRLLEVKDEEISVPPLGELNKLLSISITDKEYEILKEVSQNKTYAEMAESQFISINTVKFHLRNLYSKLEVSSKKAVISKLIELT